MHLNCWFFKETETDTYAVEMCCAFWVTYSLVSDNNIKRTWYISQPIVRCLPERGKVYNFYRNEGCVNININGIACYYNYKSDRMKIFFELWQNTVTCHGREDFSFTVIWQMPNAIMSFLIWCFDYHEFINTSISILHCYLLCYNTVIINLKALITINVRPI